MRLMPSLQRLFLQHGLIGLSLCGSQELQPWECARLENGIRLTHGVATIPYLSRRVFSSGVKPRVACYRHMAGTVSSVASVLLSEQI
jgi:hypothetical protein